MDTFVSAVDAIGATKQTTTTDEGCTITVFPRQAFPDFPGKLPAKLAATNVDEREAWADLQGPMVLAAGRIVMPWTPSQVDQARDAIRQQREAMGAV